MCFGDQKFIDYNITANPDTITGLDPNTTYTVMVQANCGNDTSDWTLPVSIHTPCNSMNVPFVEAFDSTSTTIDCWTLVAPSTTNPIIFTNNTLRFSSYSNANDYNQYAYSPILNTPTVGDSLQVRVRYATYGSDDSLWFGYRTAKTDTTVVSVGQVMGVSSTLSIHA